MEVINALLENFPKEIDSEEKAESFCRMVTNPVKIDTYVIREELLIVMFKTTVTSKVFTEGTYSIFTIENINDKGI